MTVEYIITIIVAVFGSGGFWAFLQSRRVRKYARTEEAEKRIEAVSEGTKALLHSQIYSIAERAIKRGCITTGELDDLENMYPAYRNLKGNHTGTTYYERAKSLPLVDESEV